MTTKPPWQPTGPAPGEPATGDRPETGKQPWRARAARVAGIAGLLLTAAVLGLNTVTSTTLVVAAVMLVMSLPLINGRPVTWIALAITIVWTSRLLTVAGPAPRFIDFLDFVLVLIAFVFAGVRYLATDRRLSPAHRKICRRLLIVAVVIALSWAFSSLGEPQRLVAAWVLALEPFLLLTAILITPMTVRERKNLLVLTTVLLCGQAIFSLAEIAAGGSNDEIKGTLLAAGAGHHVSAGGLALGFFILIKQQVSKPLVLAFGAVVLFIMIAADAKQVLFVLPLALLVLGISGRQRRSVASLLGGIIVGVAMAAVSVYALLSYQASSTALGFVDRSATNKTGKIAVADALWNDLQASPSTFIFGLGPGQSVSRFSYLTTPALLKEGSPVTLIGLTPSRGAEHYDKVAFSGPFTGDSSFTNPQSSVLGIFGDYGIAGTAAFAALIWAVLSALRRTEDARLRSAALASWTLLLPLAVVFDWLEQPPFTLAVVLITGLALRPPSSISPQQHLTPVTGHR